MARLEDTLAGLADLEALLHPKPAVLQAPKTPDDVDNAVPHIAPSLKFPRTKWGPPVVMMATGIGGSGPIRPTAAPQEVLSSTSKAVSFHVASWRPDRMVPCPGPWRNEQAMWSRIANDAHNLAIAAHFTNVPAPAAAPPSKVPGPPVVPAPAATQLRFHGHL